MYSFRSDYEEICSDEIFTELMRINHIQKCGYGEDSYTKEVANMLREKINDMNVDIHFMVGGTPTNLISIAHALRPYEAVIAAESGHINVHETGAIENVGHKILVARHIDGKLTVDAIKEVLAQNEGFHMVRPKMVFISNSTEYGTIYTKKELEDLYSFTKANDLYLYLDGARLAHALNAVDNDLTLEDINKNTDFFYIGATKNGAMLGEALVISNPEIKKYFKYTIKEHGGLLAKGSLISAQYKVLFETGLFDKNAKHANECARILKEAFIRNGYEIMYPNNTNQLFVKVDQNTYEKLAKIADFQINEKYGETMQIRFVTAFNTDMSEVLKFANALDSLKK